MNKFLVAMLAVILPATSFAKLNEQSCRNFTKYSKYIILKKQNGTPIDELLKENDKLIKNWSEPEKKIANIVIQEAYTLPNLNTLISRKEQRNQFIADQYIACKKALN